MLFIRLNRGKVAEIADKCPKDAKWTKSLNGTGWIDRWDFTSFEDVEALAKKMTEFDPSNLYMGADRGEWVSPRYDVFAAPKLGDKVSRTFNGDSYPCGEIVKITPTWQITTSTGEKFRRYKNSASWKQTGRAFCMIGGHVDERNPHF